MARRTGDWELLEDIGFLLSRSSAIAISTANKRFAEHGLRARSFSTLAYVARMDGASQRSLSDFLSLDPSQVVALVDELESMGLVERRQSAGDRRVRELSVTKLGRQRLKAAAKASEEAHAQFLDGLDKAERDVLCGLLRRIAFRRTEASEEEESEEASEEAS